MKRNGIFVFLLVLLAIILLYRYVSFRRMQYESGFTFPLKDEAEASSSSSSVAPKPQEESGNPFGIMLSLGPGKTIEGNMKVARDLGVAYYRPVAVGLNNWTGVCAECDAARQSGFKVVLHIQNVQGKSRPPEDITEYQAKVGQVLDAVRPDMVAVENEESSSLFYSGTPEEYGHELKAACTEAHKRNMKCMNGGLVSDLAALLTYQNYLDGRQPQAANDFLQRAFKDQPAAIRQINSPKVAEQITRGQELLAQYKGAGADYVNFHWYIPDTQALGETVDYLRSASGLPVLTDEIGQWNQDPLQVKADLEKATALKLPLILWFNVDIAKAKALTDNDGTLRDNGTVFKEFVRLHNE